MRFFNVFVLFALWLSQSSARQSLYPRSSRGLTPPPGNRTGHRSRLDNWYLAANLSMQEHGLCNIIDEPPEYSDPSKFNITLQGYGDVSRDDVIKAVLSRNPDVSPFAMFIAKTKSIGDNITAEHNKALAITKDVIKFTEDVNIHIIDFIAIMLKFIVHVIFEPVREWPKIKAWFKEMGKGIGRFFTTIFTKSPKESADTIFGGLLLACVNDPALFVAEVGLMAAGGWNWFNGFFVGFTAIAIAVPEKAKRTIMSVLTFVQSIDDPMLILRPILETSGDGIMHTYYLNGTRGTIGNRTVQLTGVPHGSNLSSYIPQLPTCLLPPESPAYWLRYEDFCGRTTEELVWMIFGVVDRRNLTKNDTILAWARYQDFTCCYGPTEMEMHFNQTYVSIPTVASETGCSVLYGDYPDYSSYFGNDTSYLNMSTGDDESSSAAYRKRSLSKRALSKRSLSKRSLQKRSSHKNKKKSYPKSSWKRSVKLWG